MELNGKVHGKLLYKGNNPYMKRPLFERRHYKAIASVLKQRYNDPHESKLAQQHLIPLIRDLSKMFASDNERYNTHTFWDAITGLSESIPEDKCVIRDCRKGKHYTHVSCWAEGT